MSTTAMQEPINPVIHNLTKINSEETILLLLAVDQSHVMGEERLSYMYKYTCTNYYIRGLQKSSHIKHK